MAFRATPACWDHDPTEQNSNEPSTKQLQLPHRPCAMDPNLPNTIRDNCLTNARAAKLDPHKRLY